MKIDAQCQNHYKDFQMHRLGAHHPPHRLHYVPQPSADSDTEECVMDTDQPFASKPPPAPVLPSVSEPPPAPEQPPASVQPPASDTLLQIVADVRRILERQQPILDRLDTLTRAQ